MKPDCSGRQAANLRALALITGTVGVLLATMAVHASPPPGPAFTPIAGLDAGPSGQLRMARNASGTLVVAGLRASTPGYLDDVVVSRYTNNGVALGETAVTFTGADYTDVAIDAAGNFAVAWVAYDHDAQHVFLRRFGASGAPVNYATRVDTAIDDTTAFPLAGPPSLAMNANGDLVVAWVEIANNRSVARVRRYDSAGVAQTAEFGVEDFAGQTGQSFPSVGIDGAGNIAIAWSVLASVLVQRFDTYGHAVGPPLPANLAGSGAPGATSLAMMEDGRFIVSWPSGLIAPLKAQIYARRFAAAGLPEGPETLVSQSGVSIDAPAAQVAVDACGNFVVIWEDIQNSADVPAYSVWYRRFDASGKPRVGQVLLSNHLGDAPSYGRLSDVTMDAGGNFVLAWDGLLRFYAGPRP